MYQPLKGDRTVMLRTVNRTKMLWLILPIVGTIGSGRKGWRVQDVRSSPLPFCKNDYFLSFGMHTRFSFSSHPSGKWFTHQYLRAKELLSVMIFSDTPIRLHLLCPSQLELHVNRKTQAGTVNLDYKNYRLLGIFIMPNYIYGTRGSSPDNPDLQNIEVPGITEDRLYTQLMYKLTHLLCDHYSSIISTYKYTHQK